MKILANESGRKPIPETFLYPGGRMAALPCDKNVDPVAGGRKKLWVRLGVTLEITDAEEQAIFSDEGTRMEETLSAVIAGGRFSPDGESYIPGEAVAQFNQDYGTSYEETNWCCEL